MTNTATIHNLATPLPARDQETADHLDALHIAWTYHPALELARINLEKSRHNQARTEPLIADTVDLYRQGYRNGDPFPAIIVRQASSKAKLVTVGGNHRTTAALAEHLTTHPAFIIECTDNAVMPLAYADNLRHGAQPSKTERIAQGAHLVAMGMEQRAAAQTVGVGESEISTYRAERAADQRARTLTINGFHLLAASTKLTLHRTITADPIFAAAAALTVQSGLTAPQTKGLCTTVTAAAKTSEAAALAVIAQAHTELLDDLQARAASKIKPGKRARAETAFTLTARSLNQLANVNPIDVDESAPGVDARRTMRTEIKRTVTALIAIDKALAS